jgi:hypothetical protein
MMPKKGKQSVLYSLTRNAHFMSPVYVTGEGQYLHTGAHGADKLYWPPPGVNDAEFFANGNDGIVNGGHLGGVASIKVPPHMQATLYVDNEAVVAAHEAAVLERRGYAIDEVDDSDENVNKATGRRRRLHITGDAPSLRAQSMHGRVRFIRISPLCIPKCHNDAGSHNVCEFSNRCRSVVLSLTLT